MTTEVYYDPYDDVIFEVRQSEDEASIFDGVIEYVGESVILGDCMICLGEL